MPMNLCRDCRWFEPDQFGHDANWASCLHPTSRRPGKASHVTGQPGPTHRLTCRWAREPILLYDNSCGPDGKHWEAKAASGGFV